MTPPLMAEIPFIVIDSEDRHCHRLDPVFSGTNSVLRGFCFLARLDAIGVVLQDHVAQRGEVGAVGVFDEVVGACWPATVFAMALTVREAPFKTALTEQEIREAA